MTHVVELSFNALHDLVVAKAEEDEEHNQFIRWMLDREDGPMVVSGITDDQGEPWEKVFIALSCTSEVEAWDLEDMLGMADKHLMRGTKALTLETKSYRFKFTNPDTTLLFKLTFGGSQRGD